MNKILRDPLKGSLGSSKSTYLKTIKKTMMYITRIVFIESVVSHGAFSTKFEVLGFSIL